MTWVNKKGRKCPFSAGKQRFSRVVGRINRIYAETKRFVWRFAGQLIMFDCRVTGFWESLSRESSRPAVLNRARLLVAVPAAGLNVFIDLPGSVTPGHDSRFVTTELEVTSKSLQ